jgi:hypothetical protein
MKRNNRLRIVGEPRRSVAVGDCREILFAGFGHMNLSRSMDSVRGASADAAVRDRLASAWRTPPTIPMIFIGTRGKMEE